MTLPGASCGFTPIFLDPIVKVAMRELFKEIKLLVAQGHHLTIWAEHIGDHRKYGPLFEDLGVRWFGYQEPTRWPLNSRANEKTRTLQYLLKTEWDGHRHLVRRSSGTIHPRSFASLNTNTPIIIDNGVPALPPE